MAVRPKPERPPFDPNLGQPKKVRRPTKRQQEMRRAKQAGRQASRSPGGFAGGGAIETYSAQVQRKYGGGKV